MNSNANTIENMAQVVQNNKMVCMREGGSVQEWFHQTYQGYSQTYELSSTTPELIQDLRSGRCDFLLLIKWEYDLAATDLSMNPDCSLEIRGQPLYSAYGGWMVLNDYSDKCTVLVRDV